jgi:hypothetical protein
LFFNNFYNTGFYKSSLRYDFFFGDLFFLEGVLANNKVYPLSFQLNDFGMDDGLPGGEHGYTRAMTNHFNF